MNRFASRLALCFGAAVALMADYAHAVTIPTVPVGNPGNLPHVTPEFVKDFGAVNYDFRIGKYEVTNAQYIEFLNAVDPSGLNARSLYNNSMSSDARGGILFAALSPSGSKYFPKPGRAQNPVVFVSWYDAVRFANWLHNGQGNGDTETGAYTLGAYEFDGVPINGDSITRNPGARWFLPTEDEWYKAAYHKNDGPTGSYWEYPTSSNTHPSSDQPPGSGAPDPANVGNFFRNDNSTNGYDDGFAVTGSTTYDFFSTNTLTNVGAYPSAMSPYGTLDQGGNVSEWIESMSIVIANHRVFGGGSWFYSVDLRWEWGVITSTWETDDMGFRVAALPIPEPPTTGLILMLVFSLRRNKIPVR